MKCETCLFENCEKLNELVVIGDTEAKYCCICSDHYSDCRQCCKPCYDLEQDELTDIYEGGGAN